MLKGVVKVEKGKQNIKGVLLGNGQRRYFIELDNKSIWELKALKKEEQEEVKKLSFNKIIKTFNQ